MKNTCRESDLLNLYEKLDFMEAILSVFLIASIAFNITGMSFSINVFIFIQVVIKKHIFFINVSKKKGFLCLLAFYLF